MNEHETAPEGQQAPAGEQAQVTNPAEGYRHPAEGLRGPSGSSDETIRPEPVTQTVPAAVVGRPGYNQYPPSPWAAPAGGPPPHVPSGPPAVPAPPPSQWAQQQPTSAAPASAYAAAYPGQSQSHPGFPGGQPPAPPWGPAAGPASPPPSSGGRGFGRFAATAAAAVVLALGAGTVGAVAALSLDDDNGPANAANTTGTGEPAPVIDRSSLASIAAAVQDSVVSITTDTGEGSGVVLTPDGYILSNNHVVAGAANDRVVVVFADGTKANATVVGTDARTDLGVVKAEGVSGLTAAKFGDSASVKVGDTVLALGSPLGLQGSVTAGIISAKDRTIQVAGEEEGNPLGQQSGAQSTIAGLLQTDAPINPGNSGGALVNTNGEVVGINTAIATSGQGSGSIGLGFAIPSNKAKEVSEALKTGQKVSHPFLGVSLSEAEGGGALVSSVSDNSPAQKAGIQRGDVITQIDGKPVNSSDDVITAVQAGKVGQQMVVTYTRSGKEQTVNTTLAEAS